MSDRQDLTIEYCPIDSLQFDPQNARKHDAKNIKAIKGSLKKFGQQKPIVVDKNGFVVAGNGTLDAAKALGWKNIAILRTDLDGADKTAYALADNRSGELAGWEITNLASQLDGLRQIDFDLDGIGFDAIDLDKFLPELIKEGLIDDDTVPEVTETTCKPGDLWQLGEHRLLCGDSTNIQHVERLMGGEKADMVFTDPPYGIDVQTDRDFASRSRVCKGGSYKKIEGDQNKDCARDVCNLILSFNIEMIIIWGCNHFAHALPERASWLVWDKRVEEKQTDDQSDCELAWVYGKSGRVRIFRHLWKGMIKGSEHGQARTHPTQKPIALAEWCFDNYGKPKSVLDLFLGSGSTLIACEKTNRKCFGMEIDPHYCDVILARWEKFTGKQAKLEAAGDSANA